MTNFYGFDPRENIRKTIGYTKFVDGEDRSTISFENNVGDTLFIPLYMPGEVRSGNLPHMPFIEMILVNSPSSSHNVDGGVRFNDAYIDMNLYYHEDTYISSVSFGRDAATEIVNQVMTYRDSVPSTYRVEIINDGREIIEQEEGKQTIFHRVVELHATNYK